MVDVLTEITINQPIEKVFAYAVDPDNVTTWYVNIKDAVWKTDPPVEVGSQISFVAQFLGRRLEYTYEVITLDTPSKMVMRTAQGPFPMETTYTFSALDPNTTKMTLRNAGKPSGFSKLFAPFMAKQMRKANRKDLNLLKSILDK